jgi:hypothetical protein
VEKGKGFQLVCLFAVFFCVGYWFFVLLGSLFFLEKERLVFFGGGGGGLVLLREGAMGFLMEWKAHSLFYLFGVLSWVCVGMISSSLQPLGWCEDVCFPLLSVSLSVCLS